MAAASSTPAPAEPRPSLEDGQGFSKVQIPGVGGGGEWVSLPDPPPLRVGGWADPPEAAFSNFWPIFGTTRRIFGPPKINTQKCLGPPSARGGVGGTPWVGGGGRALPQSLKKIPDEDGMARVRAVPAYRLLVVRATKGLRELGVRVRHDKGRRGVSS